MKQFKFRPRSLEGWDFCTASSALIRSPLGLSFTESHGLCTSFPATRDTRALSVYRVDGATGRGSFVSGSNDC